jgi:hypothetical protein
MGSIVKAVKTAKPASVDEKWASRCVPTLKTG